MAIVVGIVGLSGAGKDVASNIFVRKGFKLVDLDAIGHEVLSIVKNELIKVFGTAERSELAKMVFSDENKLEKLNSIVHPKLIEMARDRILQLKSNGYNVVINGALICKFKLDELCDYLIYIDAPDSLLIKRLINKGVSPEIAKNRIKIQKEVKNCVSKSDLIVENVSGIEEFEKNIEGVADGILKSISNSH